MARPRVAAKGQVGFKLNKGTIALIAKKDVDLKKALKTAADGVAGQTRSGTATVEEYVTDRQVAAVVVRAAAQARDGDATRAANTYSTRNRSAARAQRVADGGAQTGRTTGRARNRRQNLR